MHIMEGYLPASHAAAYAAASAPFLAHGIYSMRRPMRENPSLRLYYGAAAAFTFVLTALKLPSVTGSSSHATGTGPGTLLFGPTAMTVIAFPVLLFQALLLAHGGITTLGANLFSMGIVGPYAAYLAFLSTRSLLGQDIGILLAAFVGDLATYLTTSMELALAFPDPAGGFPASFVKFASIFAITQIPLGVIEAFLTLYLFRFLIRRGDEGLFPTGLLQKREPNRNA